LSRAAQIGAAFMLYDFVTMRSVGRFLIALLCSLAALAGAFYLGSLFLLLFDSNYHDGFAAVGGLIIGLVVGVVVFKAVSKKLAAWAQVPGTPSIDPR
jgi:membrane associated rhomboid family serine protease